MPKGLLWYGLNSGVEHKRWNTEVTIYRIYYMKWERNKTWEVLCERPHFIERSPSLVGEIAGKGSGHVGPIPFIEEVPNRK